MKITLIQGEVKTLSFNYNVDITGAIFSLICKGKTGVTKINKVDADFDKTEIADKKVKIIMDTALLDVGVNYMELKTVWNADNIDLSEKYILVIKESLFD